jgi:hypothetical protein
MPYSSEWKRFPEQLSVLLRQWESGERATLRLRVPSVKVAFALRQQFYALNRALRRDRKDPDAGELFEISRRLSLGVHLPGTTRGAPHDTPGEVDLVFFTATNGRWAEALDSLVGQVTTKSVATDSEASLLVRLQAEGHITPPKEGEK